MTQAIIANPYIKDSYGHDAVYHARNNVALLELITAYEIPIKVALDD